MRGVWKVPGLPVGVQPSEAATGQFVRREHAQRELGLRTMAALNLRVGLGYLDPVVKDRHATDWGVSRESVIREQVWQEHARVSDRLIRKVALWTGVGHAPKWLRRRNGNSRT